MRKKEGEEGGGRNYVSFSQENSVESRVVGKQRRGPHVSQKTALSTFEAQRAKWYLKVLEDQL